MATHPPLLASHTQAIDDNLGERRRVSKRGTAAAPMTSARASAVAGIDPDLARMRQRVRQARPMWAEPRASWIGVSDAISTRRLGTETPAETDQKSDGDGSRRIVRVIANGQVLGKFPFLAPRTTSAATR